VLTGRFEEAFLDVPQECLILTMKANQKYFPLLDASGKLTNQFLIVSNISPQDPSAVVGGNERVVRPRLADAKFFFDQDRKKTLESRVPGLNKVVYHGKLGTQGERAERVRAIAHAIVNQLRLGTLPYTVDDKDHFDVLDSKAQQAALLAKTDLLTDMVGEFPELQGIMGGYYARHEGLRDGVAIAIEDHYKPRFAGDSLPRNHTGTVVALADKLETLVGLFGIGQLPTGDKDPFALRRHALGVIRILIEKNLPLDLHAVIEAVLPAFGELISNPAEHLLVFFSDRLAVSLREQGYSAQEVDAVLALQPTRLGEVPRRLAAVRAFAALPESTALAAANKRVGNILKKADTAVHAKVDETLLQETAERALYAALQSVAPQAQLAFEQGDYTASLQVLAALRTPVDAFFDSVMVNADDAALKTNRLGLLATLHQAMNQVADLSRLAA
jgi:glycyl-tRNA synthetase beta chain